jgi:hypothetical protein
MHSAIYDTVAQLAAKHNDAQTAAKQAKDDST